MELPPMQAPPPQSRQPYGPDPGELNNLKLRLRMMDERNQNIRQKLQLIEQNMLNHFKRLQVEYKANYEDISELKKELFEVRNRMVLLIKELASLARKQDVKVLERYINLWEPLHFVTQDEVVEIVHRAVKKELEGGKKSQ